MTRPRKPGDLVLAVRMRSWCVQTVAALVVTAYLYGLLRLQPHEWREFWIAIAVYTGATCVLTQWVQARLERPVSQGLRAEQDGRLGGEVLAAAFAGVVALPGRMSLFALASWGLALLTVPAWMLARLPDVHASVLVIVASASLSGGLLASLGCYFLTKRGLTSLRDDWAAAIPDPDARQGLIRRVPLALKVAVTTSSVVFVSVFFAVLLAWTDTARPLERQAATLQLRFLEETAAAFGGPEADADADADADPDADVLAQASAQARRLGVASALGLLDPGSDAAAEALGLDPGELRFLRDHAAAPGDSTAFESGSVFAWLPVPGEPGRLLVAVQPGAELHASLSESRRRYAAFLATALVVALLAAWLLASDVSSACEAVRRRVLRVASGDLRLHEVFEAEDEMGDLARDVDRMVGFLRHTVGRMSAAAERVEHETASIAEAGGSVVGATRDQVLAVEQATGQVASIDRQVSGITGSAHGLTGNVEEASSSILQLGAAGEELNHTASALSSQIEDVSSSIEQMILSVRQIAENTQGLAQEVGETSVSMTHMASSTEEAERGANETARLSQQVFELAERGRERVRETIEGMDAIRESTDSVSAVIGGLGRRVQEIGAIVDVIDDVADETNLLALNAAIIAAQAGDQGRAFSVVADEIKDLADRVLSSTKEIGSLIRAVQSESENATHAIDVGGESVQRGVELAAEAGVSLEEITGAAGTSGERIQEIVSAVRQQARAANDVVGLMDRVKGRVEEIRAAGADQERGNEIVMRGSLVMRDVAQQTQRTTEEQSRGAKQIRQSIEGIQEAVDRIHGSLQEQSQACRSAVEFLQTVHERTTSNREATERMNQATEGLRALAEALRDDVGRFRVA